MPKDATAKPSKKESRKFNPIWLTKDWAQGVKMARKTSPVLIAAGEQEAWCKVCRCARRAHAAELKDHKDTKKHKEAMEAHPKTCRTQNTLGEHGFRLKSDASKIVDLKLAVHNACHSSVKTVDHMGELLKCVGRGGPLSDLRLHRTKCSRLIAKVVAPAMLRELVEDIGDGWYSIIVDESTDVSTVKHLALMVRYYNFRQEAMVADFLGIIPTPRVTAQVLYTAFKDFLAKVGLNLGRLFALGTDGAANLCGARHSLYALLRQNDCPDLHLIKCICHALDKCSSNASVAFPGSLEMLLRESRNWFAHSALRKQQYLQHYELLTGKTKAPHLVRLAATRWLSWHGAVKSHLAQFKELRALFQEVRNADQRQDCPMARLLAEQHEDGAHRVFLTFLEPILREIASINVAFQKSVADISQIYKDLRVFIETMARRVIKSDAIRRTRCDMVTLTDLQALKLALQQDASFKELTQVNYGEDFYKIMLEEKLSDERRAEVMKCCTEFMKTFLRELVSRLPSCVEAVEKLAVFKPSVALGGPGRPEFKDLPTSLMKLHPQQRRAMEMQWEKLASYSLPEICPGTDLHSVDMIAFWGAVWKLQNAAGDRTFKELSEFVLGALTLPLSNAVVERLFSVLAIVKNKLRNKLGLEMLDALLRIRTHLHAVGKCCVTFEPTAAMIADFNSRVMYAPRPKVGVRDDDDEEACDDPAPLGGDVDEDRQPVPHWDEMIELLMEVENEMM